MISDMVGGLFPPRTVTVINANFLGQFGPVDCSLLTSILEHLFLVARARLDRK
jgi:hypothetical protein